MSPGQSQGLPETGTLTGHGLQAPPELLLELPEPLLALLEPLELLLELPEPLLALAEVLLGPPDPLLVLALFDDAVPPPPPDPDPIPGTPGVTVHATIPTPPTTTADQMMDLTMAPPP